MAERTITLRAKLVERLEQMASEQGRTVDEVLEALVMGKARNPKNQWALDLADGMAAADIDWKEPPAGKTSREMYEEYIHEQRLKAQQEVDESGND
jgi:hypothetical protein